VQRTEARLARTITHTGSTKSTASIAQPTIVSFSPDSNIIGDGITDANVLELSGAAVAGSRVSVFDGTKLLGTTVADASGAWIFLTGKLVDGVHAFTATDSLAGVTSSPSNVESVIVDTLAPPSTIIVSEATAEVNREALSGTAEANSKVVVYDGTLQLGTTVANSSGAWSFTSDTLAVGSHTFTATATDAAGNISVASQQVSQNIGTQDTAGAASTALQAITVAEPGPAVLQNYSHLAFDDEFNSYSTIDMSNSHSAGFNWYLQNWFSTGATNSNNVTIANGVLELGGGTGDAVLVSAFANSSGGATGTVFGSGTYMEASIQFNPSGGANASVWPAFWGEAIQHIVPGAAQWAGQLNGYEHFAEVDIMEYMNGFSSTQYNGAIHDWSGTYSSNGWQYNIANYGNNIIDVGSIDWSAFHTYGLLWVPQSGNTPGHVTWYFDGQAESSIYWLGPAASTSLPGINGDSFTPSSSGQAAATYSILDGDQLALSLQTDSSWPMSVDWVRVWQAGSASASTSASTSTPVAAPAVTSFSPDSGVAGDGITNAKTLTVSGTAAANSVVLLYDGTTWLGTATANSTGAWSFTTGSLADGAHSFIAAATDAQGDISTASAALAVTVDTVAPAVTESLSKDTGSSSTDKITWNDALTGSGDPNAVVHFTVDGHAVADTATANASGVWTFTPTGLADGTHTLVASETDAAGNTGTASLTLMLDTKPPVMTIGNEVLSNGHVTLTGTTAEATDTVSIYDGSTLLGTAAVNSDDTWSFTTGSVSNAVHTYTATATDTAGNIGNGSNETILGSTRADTLVGTSGNDIMIGNGGNDKFTGGGGSDTLMAGSGSDTFIFKAITDSTTVNPDVIVNFNHANDTIEFTGISGINSSHGIAAFQGQLTGSGNLTLNAHSVGYMEVGGNTEVLVNTTNRAETVTIADVHTANMEIVFSGIHLGFTGNDFHIV
jgi:hypothetical protein